MPHTTTGSADSVAERGRMFLIWSGGASIDPPVGARTNTGKQEELDADSWRSNSEVDVDPDDESKVKAYGLTYNPE